jgi:DNA modification methylase
LDDEEPFVSFKKPALDIQPTTLWDYPSQHYGTKMQGRADYRGATPSYVIWNLLKRYTREGDLVVDPFCGSGTTLDVCTDLGRSGRGFDLHQIHPDVVIADARQLPLADDSVDFVFADPPYSTNLKYSDDGRCIGRLSAYKSGYFEAMADVLDEMYRVLKPRRYLGIYVCDCWSKKEGFVPIGSMLQLMMAERFKLIDHISIVRRNKQLKQGNRRAETIKSNTFMRGFNHLLIAKKVVD